MHWAGTLKIDAPFCMGSAPDVDGVCVGWPCSPAVALALAEIYFHAVVQQQKAEPDCKQSKPASCPSKHDQLLHSCTLNVGVFEAVLLQQQSSLSANTASDLFEAPAADNDQLSFVPQDGSTARSGAGSVNQPALPELLVRYHWLGACVSEHLKHFVDAAQHYRACKAALSALPQSSDNATVVRSALAGASSSICTELLERRLEALRLVSIVEDGRKCLDEGMHEELVSRLAPVLLADTVSTPLDLPQQLVGLGLLQACHTTFLCSNATAISAITLLMVARQSLLAHECCCYHNTSLCTYACT